MPKIPTYEPKVQPSESTKPLIQNPYNVGRTEEAWEKTAVQVGNRADQYKQERDIIDASTALSNLADEERSFLVNETQNKKGRDADGAVDRGAEFYNDAIKRHSSSLFGNSQKIFTNRALQLRDTGIDRLATHQATEHQREKQSLVDKGKAELDALIKSGGTEAQVLSRIDMVNQGIRDLHRGIDTTAIEYQFKQEALKGFLMEQAGLDPVGTKKLLDKYSDQLGADTKKAIGDFADKIDIEQNVNSTYQALFNEKKGDYEKMLGAVDSEPIGDKAKEALKVKIKQEYATAKTFRDDRREELGRLEAQRIVTMWGKKDYNGMYQAAMNSPNLSPSQREHFIVQSQAMAEAQISGKQSQFEKTNKQVEAWVSTYIKTHPHYISESQIMQLAGYGLSTDDANKYVKELKERQEKPNPRIAKVTDALKVDRKNSTEKEPIAEERYIQALDAMEAFAKQYPEKDPYNDFYIPYKQEIAKGNIRKSFADVTNKLGPGVYRPIPQQQKNEDYATRTFQPINQDKESEFLTKAFGLDLSKIKPLSDTKIQPPKPPPITEDNDVPFWKFWANWSWSGTSSKGIPVEAGSADLDSDNSNVTVNFDFDIK